MGAVGITVLIIVVIIVVIGIALVVSYNRFVAQRNIVTESWRQIDVELKRRHDLIPNLIETVKAFAGHERQVFESVTRARSMAEQVRTTPGINADQQAAAERELSGSLGRLIAVAENYPQLQSNQNFMALQQELIDTEDRIAAGRRFYNGNVRALNTRIESFPSNLIAGGFKFKKEQYFELDDPTERQAVKVDFSSTTGNAPAPEGTYYPPAQQQQAAYPPPAVEATPPQEYQTPAAAPQPEQQPAYPPPPQPGGFGQTPPPS